MLGRTPENFPLFVAVPVLRGITSAWKDYEHAKIVDDYLVKLARQLVERDQEFDSSCD